MLPCLPSNTHGKKNLRNTFGSSSSSSGPSHDFPGFRSTFAVGAHDTSATTEESYGCWMSPLQFSSKTKVTQNPIDIGWSSFSQHVDLEISGISRFRQTMDKPYRNRTYALSDCQCQAPQINHFVPAPTSSLKFISFSQNSVGVLWKWGTLKKHPKGLLGVSNFAQTSKNIFPTESLCRWKEDVGEETADDDACGQVEALPSFDTSWRTSLPKECNWRQLRPFISFIKKEWMCGRLSALQWIHCHSLWFNSWCYSRHYSTTCTPTCPVSSGWWFQPIWRRCSSVGISIPFLSLNIEIHWPQKNSILLYIYIHTYIHTNIYIYICGGDLYV